MRNELGHKASKGSVRRLAAALSECADPGPAIYELVIGGFERRASRGALTGEWIVFAKDNAGQNFFLTLATHNECERAYGEDDVSWQRRSDALIYERVAACREEFPDLRP